MSDSFPLPVEGEVIRMKGMPVSSGKIKGRCCVAMTIDEAQNIQVIILLVNNLWKI